MTLNYLLVALSIITFTFYIVYESSKYISYTDNLYSEVVINQDVINFEVHLSKSHFRIMN